MNIGQTNYMNSYTSPLLLFKSDQQNLQKFRKVFGNKVSDQTTQNSLIDKIKFKEIKKKLNENIKEQVRENKMNLLEIEKDDNKKKDHFKYGFYFQKNKYDNLYNMYQPMYLYFEKGNRNIIKQTNVNSYYQKDKEQQDKQKQDNNNNLQHIKQITFTRLYQPRYPNYYQKKSNDNLKILERLKKKYEEQQNKNSKEFNKNLLQAKLKKKIDIKAIDVKQINQMLKDNQNFRDQLWTHKRNQDNSKITDKDIQKFNKSMQQQVRRLSTRRSSLGSQIVTQDEPKEDNSVYISELMTNMIKKKRREEQEDQDQQQQQDQGDVTNSLITTFKNAIMSNQIDDLKELLSNSTKYKEALTQIEDGKYTDPNFPANEMSIYGFGERNDYSLEDLKNLPWLRPEIFFADQEKITLFETVESDDIEQGGLGDCYFLAAISSIAEFPERLERLFLIKEYQENGIYVLAMCLDGLWQDVVMDDQIPCMKYSKKPAFNRNKSGEMWVILLEKAWAKVHGGYMNIAAGLTREALRDLTGASAQTFFTGQNPDKLWDRLVDANEKKFIMTAGSDNLSGGSDAYIEKIGLAGSHAYSLLEVIQLQKQGSYYKIIKLEETRPGMNIEKLVKLRNPWGKGEWKGDWSDESYKWTQQLKKELNFVNQDDGSFFMSWNDFIKYFSDVQICYYHDNFQYSALQLQSSSKQPVFLQFDIKEKGQYYLCLNQKNKRSFPKSKNYRYSNCTILIAKLMDDHTFDYIGANLKSDKENWITDNLETGTYIAILKTPWRSIVNEFVFSIYGPKATQIIKAESSEFPKDIFQKVLISHYKEHEHTRVRNFGGQGHSDVKYCTFDNQGGMGYIAFENNSDSTTLNVTVEMLGSTNIELGYPHTGLRPSLEVTPGEIEIISYNALKMPYSTQMRIISSFSDNESNGLSLIEQAKQSSTILAKVKNGKEVNIKVYVLYHQKGLAMYYENKTNDQTLTEEIQFEFDNCYIKGQYGSYISLSVKPNRTRLLEIVKEDNNKSYKANIKKYYYTIK